MADSLPKYSYKGVKYVFVDTPVRLLEEAKCPICLELMKEPVSTSCEHLFCQNCIKDQPTCPTCRKRFTTTPDRGSVRIVKAFKVKCPNSVEGCKWQGDLGDAEEHLEEKCQHQKVKCPNRCGSKLDRKHLRRHTQRDCTHRPYKCPYCDHKGVYKDVTTVHYTTCGDFPLSCPAGCRKKIKRRNMESHLSTECPEEYISCKYVMFGCDTAVKRREKETHFSDKALHFEKSMESQLAISSSLISLFQSPTHIRPDVTSLPLSFRPWLQNTPTCYPRPPWVVKLEGFEEKKTNDEQWFSDPVYSHFGGYKMCLSVYPHGNGDNDSNGDDDDDSNDDDDDDSSGDDDDGDSNDDDDDDDSNGDDDDDDSNGDDDDDSNGDDYEGTHVSVFVHLMKGENDGNLKFPFKGHIVVSLLNQLEDKNHHTREPWSPEYDIPEEYSGRVTAGQRSGGWGYPKFIPHNDLNYNSHKNCQYLKNDCLFFRVDMFECVF